ncbi:MAG: chemotaxis protein CheW [bacterium]
MTDNQNNKLFDEDMYDEDEDEDAQKDKFLTFCVGKEDYGIDIRYVTEIIGIQKITEVPDMPDFMKGVINLRGKVIPVMDVRTRFNLQSREYDDRTCIMVVNINDIAIGLVVDTVSEVMDIPESHIEPPPRTGKGVKSSYIKGMGKVGEEVKILLDVNKLLFEEELMQIEKDRDTMIDTTTKKGAYSHV